MSWRDCGRLLIERKSPSNADDTGKSNCHTALHQPAFQDFPVKFHLSMTALRGYHWLVLMNFPL
jgi:hypothetical protein